MSGTTDKWREYADDETGDTWYLQEHDEEEGETA